jgi:mono/diheme cytochrome c family protein
MSGDPVKVEIFLDNDPVPIAVFRPPSTFELDTTQLQDGPHILHVNAIDEGGIPGVRTIEFTVRNGPGIAIFGINPGDVVEGKLPILVNAYSGSHEENFEPRRAETPSPVPTWAWVLFLGIVAWAMWYAAGSWRPGPQFANTVTYGRVAAAPPGIAAPAPATSGAPVPASLGAEVYENKCASCHQSDGTGVPGVFPPMKGDASVRAADPASQILTILRGAQGKVIGGVKYAAEMPAFALQLTDQQVAAVANHERTSWGNHAPAVSADDVTKARGAHP